MQCASTCVHSQLFLVSQDNGAEVGCVQYLLTLKRPVPVLLHLFQQPLGQVVWEKFLQRCLQRAGRASIVIPAFHTLELLHGSIAQNQSLSSAFQRQKLRCSSEILER